MGTLERGFTIVEIIIVIAVVAILSAFTIVGYGVVAQQSRDTKRRTDLESLTSAIKAWANDNAKTPLQTGGGYGGFGHGFVNTTSTDYPTNIATVLINTGNLAKDVADPKTPLNLGSYMFYPCTTAADNNRYGFFAKLEAPSAKDAATITAWQASSCTAEPTDAYYGMNYVRIFTHDN